ncbi:ribonucleotide reductase large subunit [Bacillus phage Bastille]|uniref:Ribonucleoside-diphosphate reductase n=1 Tax=Bacillus phage Bastille TaxID=57477 RepID=J9PLN1_9CAUD|nr:ribonucleotide reductase large subunit [Bacillus phage Bastille]AEQ34260.1 ribonucleotide reductase class Ia subunit [Bacillus phage Bastille]
MTVITKNRESYVQEKEFDAARFVDFVDSIIDETKDKEKLNSEELQEITDTVLSFVSAKKQVDASSLFTYLIREAQARVTTDNLELLNFTAAVFLRSMYKEASKLRGFNYKDGYGDYASHVVAMVERGKYSQVLLDAYTREELEEAGKLIKMEKDKMFSHSGLQTLKKTFLIHNDKGKLVELPQERFLTVALYLMHKEDKEKRMDFVREAYYVLSEHYVGLATPTLKNAGAPHGSLSSCHILTMDDTLESIFDVIKQIAKFSREGSGIGIFGGFLRARGSRIRGVKVTNNGILHPARLLSVLAEYVDQTGTRKAGVALYLPVWHADIMDFLELRLKTGTQEKRAHSITTGVTLPDEFMRRLRDGGVFTVFDPYEVKQKLGIDLNKQYDKKILKKGETPNPIDHAFTYWYREAEKLDLEIKTVLSVKDIYKKIFVARRTGGTPYLYFSDTSARLNPNEHEGMPYGSNLCTEIIMNMSYDDVINDGEDEEGFVVYKVKHGDLVTCNLSSTAAHRTHYLSDEEFQRVVNIQMRMLDNVITMGRLVVGQAVKTNNKYRAVGAGVLGMATLLTDLGISWESNEATEFVGEFYKRYLKAKLIASHALAVEKGSYPLFEGSDWQTGAFFDKRGFTGSEWDKYREMASKGIRFGYHSATAPTATNSIVVNGSPSIDPLYNVVYNEAKAGVQVLIAPPNYNNKTKWFYKSGFEMDEMWSINHVAAAQLYTDQGISHNMHVSSKIKGSEMLRLDLAAWEKGLKTIYYTHTEDREKPADCIMCAG